MHACEVLSLLQFLASSAGAGVWAFAEGRAAFKMSTAIQRARRDAAFPLAHDLPPAFVRDDKWGTASSIAAVILFLALRVMPTDSNYSARIPFGLGEAETLR